MTDERDEVPPPQEAPAPTPAPVQPDQPANVLGGIFLIGCGLCLLLVGGGCTTILILVMMQSHSSGEGSMLVVSLALAGGGIFAIVHGFRMARGRRG
jgi:hypothetical protein